MHAERFRHPLRSVAIVSLSQWCMLKSVPLLEMLKSSSISMPMLGSRLDCLVVYQSQCLSLAAHQS